MNVKKVIAFIVFTLVSCMVAAASALWEQLRRLVQNISYEQPMKKRYGDM